MYHCTVVLLLRLSSDSLNELWPRLWPHLLTDMWQTLSQASTHQDNEENLYLKSIFILIDILTILMNQDFQLYKWIFFYESSDAYNKSIWKKEETTQSFIPFFSTPPGHVSYALLMKMFLV